MPTPQTSQNASQEESDSAETDKILAEKKRLLIAARIEQERRDQIEEMLKMHSLLEAKLEVSIKSLEDASLLSERLQQHLGRSRLAREINMDRRLRTQEMTRTINAARQHISRIQKGSVVVGKLVRETMDELVRPDSFAPFE